MARLEAAVGAGETIVGSGVATAAVASGFAVGFGVGFGVGLTVGFGLGVAAAFTTTVPVNPWRVHV